jgi:hypothetical protein
METDEMRRILKIGQFIAVLSVVLCVNCANAVTADDIVEESRVAWNKFLSDSCATGQREQAIRTLMNGRFRDVGLARANDEVYRLLFLLDDFHQVEFSFDKNSRLLLTPIIEPRGQWVRMPNGDVHSIPSPTETKLKTKAQELAIEYIRMHTNHNRDSLSVYCKRSNKPHAWDVVIMINSLQVDTPNYLLEITDDGQVAETRKIKVDRK